MARAAGAEIRRAPRRGTRAAPTRRLLMAGCRPCGRGWRQRQGSYSRSSGSLPGNADKSLCQSGATDFELRQIRILSKKPAYDRLRGLAFDFEPACVAGSAGDFGPCAYLFGPEGADAADAASQAARLDLFDRTLAHEPAAGQYGHALRERLGLLEI